MPRTSATKTKLLKLMDFLYRQSDEEHPVTVGDITDYYASIGIKVDRKTVYDDLEALEQYGMDIIKEREGFRNTYYIGEREFQLAEIKLLIDIVQSAKFISVEKSDLLVNKLKKLVSNEQAKGLRRQLYVPDMAKSSNERIYYAIDDINQAIVSNRKIKFRYSDWSVEKKEVARRNGGYYNVSPYSLVWDNQFYYLVAFDNDDRKIKHFRVDKIMYSSNDFMILDEERDGIEEYSALDLSEYTSSHFGMFGGEPINVTFECENSMVGILLDRFGTDIVISKLDSEHFRTTANVTLSQQFFGWVSGLGKGIKITAPAKAVDFFRKESERLREQYK